MSSATPALRILARRLGNPIGRRASFRELLELVRRYRSLSPAARGVVQRVVANVEAKPVEELHT